MENLNFKSYKVQETIIESIINLNSEINAASKKAAYAWIPSHVGIRENDCVDGAAKEATNGLQQNLPVSRNKEYWNGCHKNFLLLGRIYLKTHILKTEKVN